MDSKNPDAYTEFMEIVYTIQSDPPADLSYTDTYPVIMEKALEHAGVSKNAVCSVIFCNDDQIHEINRDYRGIDRPTDVISFAMLEGDTLDLPEEEEIELGDIFINRDAIIRQAKEYGHPVQREGTFLFCHGILHLLGYDHMVPEDEKVMFDLQEQILDEVAGQ